MVRLLFLYYSIWLNPEARKMKRFLCSDWLPGRVRWARFSPVFFPSFSLSFFLATFSVLIAEYWPLSFFLFCVFIDVLSSSRSIKACKITWPISSYLDLKFRIDVPLSKVLNSSFQVLRTPNARRRERRIWCCACCMSGSIYEPVQCKQECLDKRQSWKEV